MIEFNNLSDEEFIALLRIVNEEKENRLEAIQHLFDAKLEELFEEVKSCGFNCFYNDEEIDLTDIWISNK